MYVSLLDPQICEDRNKLVRATWEGLSDPVSNYEVVDLYVCFILKSQ